MGRVSHHYFLVVGEASGDLHASNLMRAILHIEPDARFTFMGGPLMRSLGGNCVVPSEEMAFMGFTDVARHFPTIRHNAKKLQAALREQQPDVVICVDYASFSFTYILPIVKRELPKTKVVYYIPPKVWAWKKHRIKTLRSHTDLVLCIFPFEVPYFAQEGLPQAIYVGNPTYESVQRYLQAEPTTMPGTKSIALLPGSRQSEIKKNLPLMLQVASRHKEYTLEIGMAPGVPSVLYHEVIAGSSLGEEAKGRIRLTKEDTYGVVRRASATIVTSGTATLETALLGTPQVVAYAVGVGYLANVVFQHLFTIPYISLVNLIAEREVVQELYGGRFNEGALHQALAPLLAPDSTAVRSMQLAYDDITQRLSTPTPAAETAATHIISLLDR